MTLIEKEINIFMDFLSKIDPQEYWKFNQERLVSLGIRETFNIIILNVLEKRKIIEYMPDSLHPGQYDVTRMRITPYGRENISNLHPILLYSNNSDINLN